MTQTTEKNLLAAVLCGMAFSAHVASAVVSAPESLTADSLANPAVTLNLTPRLGWKLPWPQTGMRPFWRKIVCDIETSTIQPKPIAGRTFAIPKHTTASTRTGGSDPLWPMALVKLADMTHVRYGDHAEEAREIDKGLSKYPKAETRRNLVGSMHFYRCLGLAADIADVLGKPDDATRDRKETFKTLCPVSQQALSSFADGLFYRAAAAIRPDSAHPGFKPFFLNPDWKFNAKLDNAKATYDSPYGRIVSDWKREGDKLVWNVTVPPNSTATAYVLAASAGSVKADGVKVSKMENGRAVCELQSGSCRFESALSK